nr:hypothetical protein [Renibacterium salmoninarum]
MGPSLARCQGDHFLGSSGLVERQSAAGQLAVASDFFDRTWGRADSFYDGSTSAGVQHIPAADAYCQTLRGLMVDSLRELAEPHQSTGVVAVINGPRFSSPAESAWLASAGCELISMTQYTEPILAAELNLGFATLCYITDADTGHDGSEPVTAQLVFERLRAAQPRISSVLSLLLSKLGAGYSPEQRVAPEAVAAVLDASVLDASVLDGTSCGS